ncbi:MAG: tRNA 2-thiouridine(34) synthase MnmA [Planctomycetes bacterium]|nr:tRNA 2-thiouridine(34) synthase MnmA [Planctomycetota bacterium]
MKKRALVGMSGGIDSSVAAYLLKKQGYDVIGVFMRNGVEVEASNQKSCCSVDDAYDARRVADMLGIPFYSVNLKKQFKSIINYFVSEYDKGRTPNPCAMCNRYIKFGEIFRYAETLKCDYVATGHYARIQDNKGTAQLLKGIDNKKDQSYFLFDIDRTKLGRILMPIGDYTKSEVRQIAEREKIPVVNKPESQQICFVPSNDYRNLLKTEAIRLLEGPIKTTGGRTVGKHNGYQFYTIGQREGLGVSLGEPMYVVNIVPEENLIVIGNNDDLLEKNAIVRQINWLKEMPQKFDCFVQIRYNSEPEPAVIEQTNIDSCIVSFKNNVRAVTPGQAAVFYSDQVVLGGGWIEKSRFKSTEKS